MLLEAKGIGSPAAEIPDYVSCLMYVLETKPMSYVSVASSFNYEGIFAAFEGASQERRADKF